MQDFSLVFWIMPTVSTHLPDDWSFKDKFLSKINDSYRGKPAPYLREVIERDLSGGSATPDALSPTVLADLFKSLRPDLAGALDLFTPPVATDTARQKRNGAFSQVAALARILEAVSIYLRRKSETGQMAFDTELDLIECSLLRDAELALLYGEKEIALAILRRITDVDSMHTTEEQAEILENLESKNRKAFVARWKAELDLERKK